MGFPFHRRETVVSVGITESGRQFAQNTGYSGPAFLVLATLADHSPQSINNLERQTHLNRKILAITLRQLAAQGMIQPGVTEGY